MRIWLSPLIAALLAACAHPKTTIEYAQGADINHYHRIGVLPFNDRRGHGRQISTAIGEALSKHGFELVDTDQMLKVYSKYRPDPETGMGISELTEIKQSTHADALISGAVDPTGLNAVMVMVDTDLGDEVFKATLYPLQGRKFKDQQEIIHQIVGLFGDLPTPDK